MLPGPPAPRAAAGATFFGSLSGRHAGARALRVGIERRPGERQSHCNYKSFHTRVVFLISASLREGFDYRRRAFPICRINCANAMQRLRPSGLAMINKARWN